MGAATGAGGRVGSGAYAPGVGPRVPDERDDEPEAPVGAGAAASGPVGAVLGPAPRADATAGLVLGIQSVPDGLANGLLAGVNPLAGLYGYLVGTAAGALSTSSSAMAIQGTGAMAMIIADVGAVHGARDPEAALATLALLTGVAMLVAGLLRLGSLLRFLSNAVLVGFINAVGVNIVLGQLENLTGYASDGPNRLLRAIDTLVHPGRLDGQTVAIGLATMALVLLLERTPLGSLGMVVALVSTSAAAVALGWEGVASLRDLGIVPDSLPTFSAPTLRGLPALLVPAASLAFVGLVQGASISTSFPDPDGTYPDVSRDFSGQGVANVASGLLSGVPVGGSMSATALNRAAGGQTRRSLLLSALVMVIVVVAFGDVVGDLAMPSLAGLLIVVGIRTVKPEVMLSVWRTGAVQKTVLGVTFLLTMVVPLQYAVVVGVGLSVVLHVVRQSNEVSIRRRVRTDDGEVVEVDPPLELGAGDVVVLQPYGSLFFAAAPIFEAALPVVAPTSTGSVVILRLRGRSDLGTTFMEVLRRYAESLRDVGSKLVIVSAGERLASQLEVAGVVAVIGADNLYPGDERVGATLRRAEGDALAWVAERRG